MKLSPERRRQLLALAAACQALGQVGEIARNGRGDPALINVCLAGLLEPYRQDIERIYNGLPGLRAGLTLLRTQLTEPRDVELTGYLLAILHLEQKLRRDPQRLQELAAGLEAARRQNEYFEGGNRAAVAGRLGELYGSTVGSLRPRIMVRGAREHLEQSHNADLIRALLLSAIRAASFWREHGGNRWQLLFSRRRLVADIDVLLQ